MITGVNRTSDPRIGEPFYLECTFVGIPTPTVVWSKDGIVLNQLDDNIKIIPAENSSRLEITEATDNFNGIYKCNISNIAGFTSKLFHITLEGKYTITIMGVVKNNTVVSWASAHSWVSAHVTVLAARMESTHSRASAQVT